MKCAGFPWILLEQLLQEALSSLWELAELSIASWKMILFISDGVERQSKKAILTSA